jgi:hypothetical protein
VGLPDTNAGLAHQGDFTIGFKLNHGVQWITNGRVDLR